jgi:hypothetical protein
VQAWLGKTRIAVYKLTNFVNVLQAVRGCSPHEEIPEKLE